MRRSWRHRLITVVVSVLAVAAGGVVTAAPAAAATVNAGTFDVTAGSVGTVTDGPTSTIQITAARTILTWRSAFTLAADATLDFEFASDDATVLIRLPGPGDTALVHGKVRGYLNAGRTTNFGGNLWFSAPGGVLIGPGAEVDTGGLLLTTADVADADFGAADLAGRTTHQFVGSSRSARVEVHGAVRGHGGHLVFVAPTVLQSSPSGGGITGERRTDALFGGAAGFFLTLGARPDGSGHRSVLAFDVPPDARSSSANPVVLDGTVDAGNVYAVSDSSYTATDGAGALGPWLSPHVRASGVPADRSGSLVVVAGGGLSRDSYAAPPRASLRAGARPQAMSVGVALHGEYQTAIAASGDLTLQPSARLSGQQVVLATGDDLVNLGGHPAIAASHRWVAYAPTPDDVTGGLDSGATAVWNADLDSRPPSTVVGDDQTTGQRYVFRLSPVVTFTADDQSKDFDTAYAAGTTLPLTARTDGYVHPGVPGLFLGDTAPAYTGAPTLSSAGAAHDAPQRSAGAYPIAIAQGSLASPLGYSFRLVPGRLQVTDSSAPAIIPRLDGALGDGGWYTSDVALAFDVVDLGSDLVREDAGCADRAVTVDQLPTTYTCRAESFGGTSAASVAVKRDASAPVLVLPGDISVTTAATSAVVTWPSPAATDQLDAAPAVACSPSSGASFPLGTTPVTCSATDHAGNVARGSFDVTVTAATATATFDRPVDPAPMVNVAKLGRTIPVKVVVTVGGQPVVGPSSVPVHLGAATAGCATAATDDIETYAAPGTANTSNLFRWDAASSRWSFNLDTGKLGATAGTCYRIPVFHGGQVVDGRASGGQLAGVFHLLVR